MQRQPRIAAHIWQAPGFSVVLDCSRHVPQPYQIHIRSASECLRWGDLVAILERLLPVKFGHSREGGTEGAGEIIIEGQVGRAKGIGVVPSLQVPQSPNSSGDDKLVDLAVDFADDPEVPFPFRGRSLRTKVAAEPKILCLDSNQKVLASSALGPVWAVSEEGGVKRFRSGFALPDIPPDANLQGVFNGERFLEMLPLFHWIR